MTDLWDKLSEESEIEENENTKLEPLLEEINLLKDDSIRSFTRAMMLNVDEFWTAPSSPSGVYHPPDEHGEGGDVLHTQRVVRIVRLLAESQERDPYETDILTSAALLHDILKVVRWAPDSVSSDPLHPITVDLLFRKLRQAEMEELDHYGSSTTVLDMDTVNTILRLVRCHLGPWSPIPELVPVTPFEMTVHWADYIASNLHKIVDFTVE